MQIPDSPAPAEPSHFYDVDELGNLVRRSPDARTTSTAAPARRLLYDYDPAGRLERVSEVLWTASGGARV